MTLEELYGAHEGSLSPEPSVTNGHVNGVNGDEESAAMMRTFGGDRRLLMNGYTVETLNMLLLPMVTTKLVQPQHFVIHIKSIREKIIGIHERVKEQNSPTNTDVWIRDLDMK